MRKKSTVLLVMLALVVALGVSLASSGARRYFRTNHLLYLRNAHRYGEALEACARLRAEASGPVARLPEDFEPKLLQDACDFYLHRDGPQGSPQKDYEALLHEARRQPALLPLARRKQLELLALRDRNSSPTLQVAREILTREGYDADALWWATVNQYRVSQPLTVPRELIAYRANVESSAWPGEKIAPQQATRRLYLKALLALADHDWAGAADAFEQYASRPSAQEPSALAHGLALLRAGRPDAATTYLRQLWRAHPQDATPLIYLCEAYLAAGDYPWAAAALDELLVIDPSRESVVLHDVFGQPGTSDPLPATDPFDGLGALLAPEGHGGQDVTLWSWMATMARTPAEQARVKALANGLIAANAQRPPDALARLGQYCLWTDQLPAAQPLFQPAVNGLAGPWCQSLARVFEWFPQRDREVARKIPLASLQLRRLLSRNVTTRFDLTLPPGASMLVVMVQGYSSRGVWPIVNVDLGEFGARQFYVNDSRRQARPLLMALRWPLGAESRQVQAAVSLLNASEGTGESRSLMIADVLVF